MIAAVYIPHQSPPHFSAYRSADHVIYRATDGAMMRGEEHPETLEEAKERLGQDMHRALWIESAADLDQISSYTGHQQAKVRALYEEAREYFDA